MFIIIIAITASQNLIHTIAMSTLLLDIHRQFHGPLGYIFQNFISPTVGKLFVKSDLNLSKCNLWLLLVLL